MKFKNTKQALDKSIDKIIGNLKALVTSKHTDTGALYKSIKKSNINEKEKQLSSNIEMNFYAADLENGKFLDDWIKKSADIIVVDIAESLGRDIGEDYFENKNI